MGQNEFGVFFVCFITKRSSFGMNRKQVLPLLHYTKTHHAYDSTFSLTEAAAAEFLSSTHFM
jgi:hypothetical protein